jgi:hypothetical protein
LRPCPERICPQWGHCWARLGTRLANGLGLDFADRVFERQALARNVRFGQRRFDTAQLCDQSRARPFVQCAASLAGAGAKPVHGAGDERMIVGHFLKLTLGSPKFHLTLRTDFA